MNPVTRAGLCGAALALALAAAVPRSVAAQEAPLVAASKSMQENLAALSGKAVTLHLANGHTLAGKVAEVGEAHLRLAELSGKEYFDALVRIDAIVALEVRARGG